MKNQACICTNTFYSSHYKAELTTAHSQISHIKLCLNSIAVNAQRRKLRTLVFFHSQRADFYFATCQALDSGHEPHRKIAQIRKTPALPGKF